MGFDLGRSLIGGDLHEKRPLCMYIDLKDWQAETNRVYLQNERPSSITPSLSSHPSPHHLTHPHNSFRILSHQPRKIRIRPRRKILTPITINIMHRKTTRIRSRRKHLARSIRKRQTIIPRRAHDVLTSVWGSEGGAAGAFGGVLEMGSVYVGAGFEERVGGACVGGGLCVLTVRKVRVCFWWGKGMGKGNYVAYREDTTTFCPFCHVTLKGL